MGTSMSMPNPDQRLPITRSVSNAFLFFQKEARVKNLVRAYALSGRWGRARELIENNRDIVRAEITVNEDTILHVAVRAKQTDFVEKLLDQMKPDDLVTLNKHGYTALCLAASSGVTKIAKLLVKKNRDLPLIRSIRDKKTPLLIAVLYKHRKMASYLLSKTELDKLTVEEQIDLFHATLNNDLYDISLKILQPERNYLAIKRCKKTTDDDVGDTPLHVMARKPSAIMASSTSVNRWKALINSCINWAYEKDVMKASATELVELLFLYVFYLSTNKEMVELTRKPNLLHLAASVGNVNFLVVLIQWCPDIIFEEVAGKNIIEVAIESRFEMVFSLLYEIGWIDEFLLRNSEEKMKCNILCCAAKQAAPHHLNRVSGAALQMQRELIWFKEIEKIVSLRTTSQLEAKIVSLPTYQLEGKIVSIPTSQCEAKIVALPTSQHEAKDDKEKRTPRQQFTEKHEELRKRGEKWMQDTANSCMLVSTLIATVVFAAAFTIPGNYDKAGTPIFQRDPWFTVFIISDATALISSSTSILIFLSILTSRYAEEDFLHSLPTKLLWGIGSLFISIVCMVMTFGATFFILYTKASIWVPAMITAMMMFPVGCFGALHIKLCVDIFDSTFLSRRKLLSKFTVGNWHDQVSKIEEGSKNYHILDAILKTGDSLLFRDPRKLDQGKKSVTDDQEIKILIGDSCSKETLAP